ncbi:hypothetical protein ABI59_04365 [Acidobacteria bacterium Mor1]|nr:hypothetical protein ABI59_04365 [Acidobacteria bacterium Mor1]
MRLWTIGHSNRPIATLLDLLAAHAIEVLADVRTVPRSKRHPQFDGDNLAWELEQSGRIYRHEKGLGGLRKPRADSINTALPDGGFRGYADHMQSESFSRAVAELLQVAESRHVALMCAEASPVNCHRSLLSDALVARGVEVRHILDADRVELHRRSPLARVEPGSGAGRPATVTYPGLLF